MDHFQEIFTPPASPAPDYNPRENILHQIRSMEDGERRDARARQFINQFPGEQQNQGAVGGAGQGYPPVILNNTNNESSGSSSSKSSRVSSCGSSS